jgi:mono/diheme cytochrome c family protein
MIRSILTLGLVTAIGLPGPAWSADPAVGGASISSPPGATGPVNGAQLFATHCAMCHRAPELAARLQEAPDRPGTEAKMTAFLIRHGRSDTEADAAILQFLASQSP